MFRFRFHFEKLIYRKLDLNYYKLFLFDVESRGGGGEFMNTLYIFEIFCKQSFYVPTRWKKIILLFILWLIGRVLSRESL